ncbi:MAG: sel1 repeat family protein [Campylobacteraceae bacterium]|jgi:TPR repeat protein|nr:sel1 repeat family protein [Campylobacteraceae bacterium]
MRKGLIVDMLFCLVSAVAIIYVSKLYYSPNNTLTKWCDGGDAISCYNAGYLYDKGSKYIEKDEAKAIAYFKKGCDANHAQSCQYLGDLDINGTDDLIYIQKACDHNNAKACFTLGQMSKNSNESSNETASYFKKSCENGNTKSCFELASLYVLEKYDDENNIKKAFYLFENLCEKNNYEACYNLGKLYHKNKYAKYQTRAVYAIKYYQLACNKGEIENACKALKNLNDYLQDILKFRKLCSLNDAYSCNKLAHIYASPGTVIDYDYAIAAKFYKKSCDELNDKIACSRIVSYYYWTHDDINELKYAAKNCDEGKISFCSTAANLYLYSEHSHKTSFNMVDETIMMFPDPLITDYVPKNVDKAIFYFQKACDKNSWKECNELGDIYSKETGVKNIGKARLYYTKACNAGDEKGCQKLKSLKQE